MLAARHDDDDDDDDDCPDGIIPDSGVTGLNNTYIYIYIPR